MNRSLRDTGAGLLLVPQFTLAADTRQRQPSWLQRRSSASGSRSRCSSSSCDRRAASTDRSASGLFGAHMQVSLVNDGPVTFWLEVPPSERPA